MISSKTAKGDDALRVFLAAILLLGIAVGTGCAAAPSPPPPDLSEARDTVLQRTTQMNQTLQWMARDLRHFAELRMALAQSMSHSHEENFPISLYRLVAINCLNEEVQAHDGSTITHSSDITECAPQHLDRLLNTLADVSSRSRDQALANLERIDEMRKLRGLLRLRISRIPQIIQANQLYLVEQRAELRQLQTELTRRRSLYSSQDFNEATAAINEQHQLLATLEDAIESLTVLYPEWPAQLDLQVNSLYMDLADLR
ncbi:MAG: hypothetical protein ACNA8W_06200 [Bradymonadaceae bacterium]